MTNSMFVNLRFIREVAQPRLAEDGLAWVMCPHTFTESPDEGAECGQFTVVAIGSHWVCPVHGDAGVMP